MIKDEALRLALEALEYMDVTAERYVDKQIPENAITAIKEALAQTEQDLVEWGVDWGPDGNSVSIIKRLADGGIEVVGWEYAPHPPQRTWVGLTDEDKSEICDMTERDERDSVMRFVEAKLKARNI